MGEFYNRAAARRHSEKMRQRIKRSWDSGERHAAILRRGVDADTVRFRALEDRRGVTVLQSGNLVLAWSVLGRTDQLDIFDAGKKVFTGSPHRCMDELLVRVSPKSE